MIIRLTINHGGNENPQDDLVLVKLKRLLSLRLK